MHAMPRLLHVVIGVCVGLVAAGPALADNCSRTTGAAISMLVRNDTAERIRLYWVNGQCQEVQYGEIAAGRSVTQPTYVGHVWRLKHATKGWMLREVTASPATPTVRLRPLWGLLGRSEVDRPDDAEGTYQIHVVYALARDGTDRQLDTEGKITRTVAAADRWLKDQTGGPRLRWDTSEGSLDVSFVRLRRTAAELRSAELHIRDRIEEELRARNLLRGNKLYLVFYDGGAGTNACGGAAWPPDLVGRVVGQYLQGTPSGATPCANHPLGEGLNARGYWEMGSLHEVLHALGLAPRCARNHTLNGHVSDDPTDLMYAGAQPWRPSVLDVGRDDYFRHGRRDCPDLARSVFLDPLPANAARPPHWPE